MVGLETGLRSVQQVVSIEEFGELVVDGILKDFGREGEQRDGAVVLVFTGVSRGFLEDGSDLCGWRAA